MPKYTSEQYSKIFWKLPAEIRDIITSYSTTEHLRIIGQKHNLHIDKIGDMVEVTFDAMMGIVSTKDFVKELSVELGISLIDASVLARDIDENIFSPIKQTMVDLYRNGAPYKPSSSLVQFYEEDEEHLESKKDEILKEIESPVEATIRKENVPMTFVSKPVSNEVAAYHEELENKKAQSPIESKIPEVKKTELAVEIKPEVLESKLKVPQTPQNTPTDFLNRIAGMKLSNTFVMPKEDEIGNIGAKVPDENKTFININDKPATNSQTSKISKPDLSAQPVEAKPKIDPYREQI